MRATLRVRKLPAFEAFFGVFFHTWEQGSAAVRDIAQAGVGVSMLRMSNALELTTTLALSGQAALVKWAGRGLQAVGFGNERSLLVFGVNRHPPPGQPGALGSAGNHPGTWRADDRDCDWQDVEEIPLLFTLLAKLALGSRAMHWTPWKQPSLGLRWC